MVETDAQKRRITPRTSRARVRAAEHPNSRRSQLIHPSLCPATLAPRALSGRHHPRGFRPPGFGPVGAHTSFTFELLTHDLHLFTEGTDLMATAESWGQGGSDRPAGVAPAASAASETREPSSAGTPGTTPGTAGTRPEQHASGGREEAGGDLPVALPSPAGWHGEGERGREGHNEEEQGVVTTARPPNLLLTESEAWEGVAREVRLGFGPCAVRPRQAAHWRKRQTTITAAPPVPSLPARFNIVLDWFQVST